MRPFLVWVAIKLENGKKIYSGYAEDQKFYTIWVKYKPGQHVWHGSTFRLNKLLTIKPQTMITYQHNQSTEILELKKTLRGFVWIKQLHFGFLGRKLNRMDLIYIIFGNQRFDLHPLINEQAQDENSPFSQLKHFWMSTECSQNVHWNPDFRHCSVTFQWTFSPTECCWMAGTFQWPFRIFFLFSG